MNLLTSGKLNYHLADIDKQAEKNVFPAGKVTGGKRKYNGKAQS